MSFQIAKVFQMLPVFNEKRVWTDTGQDTSGSDSSALFYPESSSPEGRYTSTSVFSSKQEKLQWDLGGGKVNHSAQYSKTNKSFRLKHDLYI